jgi:hypothetical protein
MALHRFVIEVYDPETECIASEHGLEVSDLKDLSVVGIEHFSAHDAYDLDADDVAALIERFGLAFDASASLARIRRRRRLDDAPYRLHTGRELAMMLTGTKPLAVFFGPHLQGEEVVEIPERMFRPHVASGRFVMREIIEPASPDAHPPMRRVLYALPHEAWRIDDYLSLLTTASTSGWSEILIRKEGALLGYEDWQNDWYIAYLRQQTS